MSEPAFVVEDLGKTFRIPQQHVNTLKERALHPFRSADYREHNVLRDISFEIQRGEFFGIVGRNGSGKSTLLKCMAGIYRPEHGRISVAGRVAPFIELGVGFSPDLSAYDNVIINGVMMGLTRREAKKRFDAVIEFAELEDFLDLKLKNYSSGMQVRLAFAVMVQASADVLLIDEVLAVGDASFQQKCLDVFYSLRAEGKTIVLVTHDMGAVETFCHRAMFLQDGDIQLIGDPAEVGRAYLQANFGGHETATDDAPEPAIVDTELVAVSCEIRDVAGHSTRNLSSGEEIRVHARIDSHAELEHPLACVYLRGADENVITGTRIELFKDGPLRAGQCVEIDVTWPLTLGNGRYTVGVGVTQGTGETDPVADIREAASLVVHSADRHVVGAVHAHGSLDVRVTTGAAR